MIWTLTKRLWLRFCAVSDWKMRRTIHVWGTLSPTIDVSKRTPATQEQFIQMLEAEDPMILIVKWASVQWRHILRPFRIKHDPIYASSYATKPREVMIAPARARCKPSKENRLSKCGCTSQKLENMPTSPLYVHITKDSFI